MEINHEINRLLHFALQQGLVAEEDIIYAANLLLDCLRLTEYVPENIEERQDTAAPILENMLCYAVHVGLLEDTPEERDLFDTRIMNCCMPRPSEVAARFYNDYAKSPQLATDHYYQFSIASNYIRKTRIDKNIVWKTKTEFGVLDLTVNLSKPEKDPRDIARARLKKSSSYPRCLLCCENEGYAGHTGQPARQTHRLIPLDINGHPWFLQYSPYTYYNEHCIVLNRQHIPMEISRRTFENLACFLDIFPHYFVGSNADLPIVGGSILSHDHYQGGHYTFAMELAEIEKKYVFQGFEDVRAGRVKWPMPTIRLQSEKKEPLIELADKIVQHWRTYSDTSVDILAETGKGPHNTVTPIARRRGAVYEFDIVLRNNRTTADYPLGIFHPHAEVHHIKKENIGLIEVQGLAILPARLRQEMEQVRVELLKNTEDISSIVPIASHAAWYRMLRKKYETFAEETVREVLQQEIGRVFLQVLVDAGVYKRDAKGLAAFDAFVASVPAD